MQSIFILYNSTGSVEEWIDALYRCNRCNIYIYIYTAQNECSLYNYIILIVFFALAVYWQCSYIYIIAYPCIYVVYLVTVYHIR